jgi:hypothetical protein
VLLFPSSGTAVAAAAPAAIAQRVHTEYSILYNPPALEPQRHVGHGQPPRAVPQHVRVGPDGGLDQDAVPVGVDVAVEVPGGLQGIREGKDRVRGSLWL